MPGITKRLSRIAEITSNQDHLANFIAYFEKRARCDVLHYSPHIILPIQR